MGKNALLAQALEARATEARTLAEAQALKDEADRLRRAPRPGLLGLWNSQQLYRN